AEAPVARARTGVSVTHVGRTRERARAHGPLTSEQLQLVVALFVGSARVAGGARVARGVARVARVFAPFAVFAGGPMTFVVLLNAVAMVTFAVLAEAGTSPAAASEPEVLVSHERQRAAGTESEEG